MTTWSGLGPALRRLREAAALLPEEAAAQLGVEPELVRGWEDESPSIDLTTLGRLLDVYHVDLSSLATLLATGNAQVAALDAAREARRARDLRVEEALRALIAQALSGMREPKE
jgi:transcriptional regulator with XRE-family HTH domain